MAATAQPASPLSLAADPRFARFLRRVEALAPTLEPAEVTRLLRALPRLLPPGGSNNDDDWGTGGRSRSARDDSRWRAMAALLVPVVASLRQRAAEVLGRFSAKELPLLVNALGKLPPPRRADDRGGRRFGRMCVAAAGEARLLGECTPQGLALLLTGLPKLFRDDGGGSGESDDFGGGQQEDEAVEEPLLPTPFLLTLRDAVAALLAQEVAFLPQDLALILNGFTTLGFHPGVAFLHAHAARVTFALPRCRPQDIALLLVSYSRLRWQPPGAAMAAMSDRARATMGTYRPQDFANVLQAMGRMGYHPGEAFLRHALERVEPVLGRFNCHSLACVLHALSLLGYLPLSRVRRRVLARVMEGLAADGFQTQELCMVAHALGQMPALATTTTAAVEEDGGGGGGSDVARCLAAAVERRMGSMAARDAAMSLRALSRIGLRPVPPSLLRTAKRRLPSAAPFLAGWEAALTLHALGRLTLASSACGAATVGEGGQADVAPAPSEAARRLFRQALARRGELGAQEVSLALYSAVHLGWPGEGVVRGLCERMEDLLEAAEEERRSLSVPPLRGWEAGGGKEEDARARRRRRRLAIALSDDDGAEDEEEGVEGSGDPLPTDGGEDEEPALTSQGIALLLGALGHLGHAPSRRLQRLLIAATEGRLAAGEFTAMDYGMSLRGLANLPPLLGGGGGSGSSKGGGFVLAFADRLLLGLEEGLAQGTLSLGPQDVVMSANALAKLGLRRDVRDGGGCRLLAALVSTLQPRLREASGQALASMANVLARLRFNPGPAFMRALEKEVGRRLLLPVVEGAADPGMDTPSLSLLLWSLAVLDASALPDASSLSPRGALSPSLLERAVSARLLPEITAQLHVLEAAAAAAEAQRAAGRGMGRGPRGVGRQGGGKGTRPAAGGGVAPWGVSALETILCQTLQVLMYARGRPALYPGTLLGELRAVVTKAWAHVAPQRAQPTPSALHQQVMAALAAAGVRFAAEVAAGDGGVFSLDVVLEPAADPGTARPVVLEVDGPMHYMADDPRTPTGDTVFKQRLLQLEEKEEEEGSSLPKWAAVLSLPLWEWQDAGSRRRDKIALVERKLAAAGLHLEDYKPFALSSPDPEPPRRE